MFLHNLLNALVQIANKIGLQKKKFADRWCLVVSLTDPYRRILGFLDRRCHDIHARFHKH
jgi:hypothetical protein